jgi:hypothetical protein
MQSFLQQHQADIRGVLSGWDRIRFRGTLRRIANGQGMSTLMADLGVRMKEFKAFVSDISADVRAHIEHAAKAADRPLVYLASWKTSKEEQARQIAARDGIEKGLICILSCVEQCQTFDLHSEKAKGRLVLKPAVRRCQHYYVYELHERFGFLHTRVQSWLPLNQWVCLNGREFLARHLDAAGSGYTRADNCFPAVNDLAAAQAFLRQQVDLDWRAELNALALGTLPRAVTRFADYPMEYYWSADETEWATDVLFTDAAKLATLYPRLIRHGLAALSCPEIMRYLGKRVNADGSVPLRFTGEVLTDLRPAKRPSDHARRSHEAVRLKHRVNRNWLKMYAKADSVLRVETVINDPRDMRVDRTKEGTDPADPTVRPEWLRLRKGVADLARRAEISDRANTRYLEALAAVETDVPLGQVAAEVCRRVRWKGRSARGLNPLAVDEATLLEAVSRGEFTLNGFRNRDLRARLFPETADAAQQKRQSGQITRRVRLLRAHGLVRKVSGTHRYQLTTKGRLTISALLAARAADTKRLLAAA